jgi:glycosyltransferase involved in cell wall biosynthesis
MRILQLHNYYQQPGGEDAVVAAEKDLLARHGHEVELLSANNDGITSFAWAAAAGLNTIYSRQSHATVRRAIRRFKPDIVHVHNFLPILSPSVYYAAKGEGVPVVQTLHNYRLICPSALLMRQGKVCEECLGKVFPFPAVQHGCYRGSRSASAAIAAMLGAHRIAGTWQRAIDRYIALTEFGRQKFIQAGLPAAKITVKPNFIADPAPLPGSGQGGYAIFVGRLSQEKGIRTLLQAWTEGQIPFPLKIVGGGPLAADVRSAAVSNRDIEWLGRKSRSEVFELLRDAAFLVFPSECYEGMPITVIEAFACGTPVLASGLGASAEMVEPGANGNCFEAGNPASLATAVKAMVSDANLKGSLRSAARSRFERDFTAARNHGILIEVYASAITPDAVHSKTSIEGQ